MLRKKDDQEINQTLIKILRQDPISFKESHSFEQRFIEYQIIRCNYPGFIPINCNLQNYTGTKISMRLYVSEQLLTGHFRAFLKKVLTKKFPELGRSDNLYLMIDDDVIIKYDITLKQVYLKKAEKDGWLYIKLSIES